MDRSKGEHIVNSHGIEDDNGTITKIVAVTNLGRIWYFNVASGQWYVGPML